MSEPARLPHPTILPGMPPETTGRLASMRAAFMMTRRNDPRLVPLLIGVALLTLAVFVLLGWLFGALILSTILGVLAALGVAAIVFGRRASKAAFSQVEGQPGAAAAVIDAMRGDWRVTPAVAFNRNQDLVHRIVGRPGVVLVVEGTASRAGGLLAQERKRVGRVVGDTPIYEVLIGDGEGQVPLRKLQSHLLKLPRNLKPAQVNAIDGRLKALGGANVPIPKGPLPRGGKVPRGRVR